MVGVSGIVGSLFFSVEPRISSRRLSEWGIFILDKRREPGTEFTLRRLMTFLGGAPSKQPTFLVSMILAVSHFPLLTP